MSEPTIVDDDSDDDALPLPADFVSSVPANSYDDDDAEVVQLRLDFSPWHRPRKHYVRMKQWQSLLGTVIEKQQGAQHEVAYLGLPGQDLIDVELFSHTCAEKGRDFHFLGFDNSLQQVKAAGLDVTQGGNPPKVESLERVVADKISRLPKVSRTSRVLPDDISELGRPKSTARLAVGSRDFDIINLDLCGGGLVDKDGKDVLLSTLAAILQLQAGREWPWGLLITAAFDREGHSQPQRERAAAHMRELHARFNDCDTGLGSLPASLSTADTLDDEEYCLGAVGGLLSWLRTAAQEVRRSNVPCKSVMSYRLRTESSLSDMWSLAILVTPKRQTGNALSQATRSAADDGWTSDCEDLRQLVGRLGATVDVDAVLRDDAETFALCRDSTADLLRARGYDRAAYLTSEVARSI